MTEPTATDRDAPGIEIPRGRAGHRDGEADGRRPAEGDAVARRTKWGALAAVVFVALVHVWVISAGTFTTWPEPSKGYYDLLANAFLHGQAHLLVEPAPQLLALTDPYDARVNHPWRLHDAILFGGKYYFYWGPAPALIVAAAKVLGVERVGDHVLVFAFSVAATTFIALLLLHVHRRWFAALPGWPVIVGILAAGLANPMPFLLARPAVYEAAIIGGQCFLFAAVYFAVSATSGDRLSRMRLLLAGICAGAATSSRLSLAPFIAALLALLWWKMFWTVRPRWKALIVPYALTAAPLAMTVIGLAAYNHARFGSVSETGLDYMLASTRGRLGLETGPFNPSYLPPNVMNLLFAPIRFDARFPYVMPDVGLVHYRKHPRLPYYVTESAAGIVRAAPLLLLAAFGAPWPRGRDRASPDWWITATLILAAAALLALPATMFFYWTMRYIGDLTPALSVLATIGIWRLARLTRGRPGARTGLSAVVMLLLAYTGFVGVMLAVTGYYNHFRTTNPDLYWRLRGTDDAAHGSRAG